MISFELRTDLPQSSHGFPVFMKNGAVYGPDDVVAYNFLGEPKTAADIVALALYSSNPTVDVDLAKSFLSTSPLYNRDAKYTLKYSCGHGTRGKQLYGKERDRERYAAWFEAHMVCPDCYRAAAKAADAEAEQIAHVELCGQQITVRISGQIDANKEALMALGFRWSRDHGGAMSILATEEPPLALVLRHNYRDDETATAWGAPLRAQLDALGYKTVNDISPLDMAVFREARNERSEQIAKSHG